MKNKKRINNLKNYMMSFTYDLNDMFIIDIERRKIIATEQMISLDEDYIGHVEEFITYDLYVEFAFNKNNEIIKNSYVINNLDLQELKDLYIYVLTNFKNDLTFYNKK